MKEILRKVAPIAGYPVFFVLSFFVFFMWTFPFNKMKDRLEGAFAAQQRSTSTPQELKIDELITHRLPLERINEGFELMERGESIRSVVVY